MSFWKRIFGASTLEKSVEREIEAQIEKIMAAIGAPDSKVPDEFGAGVAHNCRDQFRDKIVEECRTCIQSNELGNQPFVDPNFGVFMMVTTFPWTTKETIEKLRRQFPANAVSYMGLRKGLIFDKWPSEDHKYYFHLLFCLGSNQIEAHSAYGDYNGSERHEQFHATPDGLMSQEEKDRVAAALAEFEKEKEKELQAAQERAAQEKEQRTATDRAGIDDPHRVLQSLEQVWLCPTGAPEFVPRRYGSTQFSTTVPIEAPFEELLDWLVAEKGREHLNIQEFKYRGYELFFQQDSPVSDTRQGYLQGFHAVKVSDSVVRCERFEIFIPEELWSNPDDKQRRLVDDVVNYRRDALIDGTGFDGSVALAPEEVLTYS